MRENENYVEMRNITKYFDGVAALKKAQLSLRRGEIHALVGENGAGKSTLIKILSGVHLPNEGEIYLGGKAAYIHSPKDSKQLGISVIYQEFALAKDLTVAENIFIEEISKMSIIKWSKLYAEARQRLESLGFGEIDVRRPIIDLSVAYQQVVEIAKALSGNVKVLVLDEPTSVLTSKEVERLFELLLKLREQQVCIVYVSHRLEEIFRLSNRITIMRDGEFVETVATCDITNHELVTKMIGRELTSMFPRRRFAHSEQAVLRVENICVGNKVRNVSFEVYAGEILGFSGLIGSGRTEAMRAIFGADKLSFGKVTLHNKKITVKTPRHAVRQGIGLLPEDRKAQGVLLDLPIVHNITLSSLKRFLGLFGVIHYRKERAFSTELIERLRVKASGLDMYVSSLSGGNQQKVSIGKWLAAKCDVLILDEPTRGVDVGAKVEIYKIISELAEQGIAVIMISSEMPEIIGMCDRVAVMRNGTLAGILKGDEIKENNIIKLAMGVT